MAGVESGSRNDAELIILSSEPPGRPLKLSFELWGEERSRSVGVGSVERDDVEPCPSQWRNLEAEEGRYYSQAAVSTLFSLPVFVLDSRLSVLFERL